jgi:hypothetical protein
LANVDTPTITSVKTGDRTLTADASATPADVIAVFNGGDCAYPSRGGEVMFD